MSGLISSLLVEPIVRQARRLSHQTTSAASQNDQPGSPRHTEQNSSLANNHGSSKDVATVLSEECSGLNPDSRCANPANDTTIPPTLSFDLSNRFQDDQCALQSTGQAGNDYRGAGSLAENLTQNSIGSVGHVDSGPRLPAEASAITRGSATTSRAQGSGTGMVNSNMDEIGRQSTLPEDDGMGALRKRIHAIRDLDASNTEKARMVHDLMTEKYNASRGAIISQSSPVELSSTNSPSPVHTITPASHGNALFFGRSSMTTESSASIIEQSNPYNLTREDLEPTFCPKIEADLTLDSGDMETEEFEDVCLGCEHYKRNVKLQCFTCKKWYPCRFCHDEVEDHHLNRRKTENMLCMLCGHAQPASQWCRQCGEQAAQYYCSVCKLWDNDSKKNIYHCGDCGICRIGQGLGKDFFHCRTCSVCLPISIENTHRCIERSTQCDCPICGDYMFTSPETVVVMRCGHSIHHKCLSEYSKSSYRCPICSKTIANMESTFRNLDRTIQCQPMPVEFKDTNAVIYCNDCGAKSVVQYHWLGLKCDLCESYNTAQIRLLHGEVLGPLEQDGVSRRIPAPRARSSSYTMDEEAPSSTLGSLQIDTSSMPGASSYPRLGTPLSAGPNGRFSSYSLTRDRAVSPVISNYFGLPPGREAEKSKSASLFGDRAPTDSGSDKGGELHIWGAKLKYQYGFLGEETESVDGTSETDSEEDYDDESCPEEEADNDDDDDSDSDSDSIDIFGHR